MTLNMNFEQKGLTSENEALKAQIAHLESALQVSLANYFNGIIATSVTKNLQKIV